MHGCWDDNYLLHQTLLPTLGSSRDFLRAASTSDALDPSSSGAWEHPIMKAVKLSVNTLGKFLDVLGIQAFDMRDEQQNTPVYNVRLNKSGSHESAPCLALPIAQKRIMKKFQSRPMKSWKHFHPVLPEVKLVKTKLFPMGRTRTISGVSIPQWLAGEPVPQKKAKKYYNMSGSLRKMKGAYRADSDLGWQAPPSNWTENAGRMRTDQLHQVRGMVAEGTFL